VRAAEGPREEAFAADGGRRDDARRDRAARRDHLLPNQVGRRAPTTSATHREKRDRRATALFATLRALVKTRGCAVFRSVNRSSRRWTRRSGLAQALPPAAPCSSPAPAAPHVPHRASGSSSP